MPFAPTVPEQNVVAAIFNKGDSDKLGIINGENAVKILTGAKLPPTVLGEIWAIADSDNNGFLTRKGVAVAVRLIGWAQKGESVSEDLLDKGASEFDPESPRHWRAHHAAISWTSGSDRWNTTAKNGFPCACASIRLVSGSANTKHFCGRQGQVHPSFRRLWTFEWSPYRYKNASFHTYS